MTTAQATLNLRPSLNCQPVSDISISTLGEGRWCYHLPTDWPGGSIDFRSPLCDVAGRWQPGAGPDRNLPVSWERERNKQTSEAGMWAPVTALVSQNDHNRCCVAVSQVTESVSITCGVIENCAEIFWRLDIPAGASIIYLDLRPQALQHCLQDVVAWWEETGGRSAAPVDRRGRVPLYATWYAYRQSITRQAIEAEAALAQSFGLGGLLVDDGWQQDEVLNNMGCTGTWQPNRLGPDAAAHIGSLREQGLVYLLWMALPFLGNTDPQLPDFRRRGWILAQNTRVSADVVDPRFPEVRLWIVDNCHRVVRDLGIDGLKLDFLDRFTQAWDGTLDNSHGRDCASVGRGVELLIEELEQSLHGAWPGMPIEFRQRYIGPVPRRCGNMLRAMDCPNDHVENRRRSVDTRLLAGNAITHADPIIWHPDEPVEAAALHLFAAFHAVPQISVQLAQLSPEHAAMLRFLMQTWNKCSNTLLDGAFTPRDHCASWNHLTCADAHRRVDMLYAPLVCRWDGSEPSERLVINATRQTGVVIAGPCPVGTLVIYNCCGEQISEQAIHAGDGCQEWPVPPAGIAKMIVNP